MTLEEIKEQLKNLDKLIDPGDINILRSEISNHLSAFEEDDYNLDLELSNEWLRIKEITKTAREADKIQEVGKLYQKSKRVKLLIKQLMRMRQDLKMRYDVITNQRSYQPF